MEIVSCLSPVKIFNKRLNDFMLVPCGKCEACRSRHGMHWKLRIEDECRCWPYSLFFTLTYDDAHLPVMDFDKDTLQVFSLETGECFELDSLVTDIRGAVNLLRKRKYRLPVVSVRDVQLFMKRLRYLMSKIEKTYDQRKVRYYIVSEYGPTTFRPHYHGILWFSSRTLCSQVEQILCKAWQCGIVDCSFVQSNASGYVAQYVNCFDGLPALLKCKAFKPFALFSKLPPIGSMLPAEESLLEVFYRGIVSRRSFDKRSQRFIDVPLPRYVKDRLFPKISGFGDLSHSDRVALYGIAKFSACETWDSFETWFTCQRDAFFPNFPRMIQLLDDFVDYRPYDEFGNYITPSVRMRKLKQLFRISRRVLSQSIVFGCTIDYYVDRIELFYSNVELFNLRRQYEFEQEFVQLYPLPYLINIDPLFVKKAVEEFHNSIETPLYIKEILKSFGLTEEFLRDVNIRDKFALESCPSYLSFARLMQKIVKDSTKTKVKNEYLSLHPEYTILHR